MSWNGIYYSYMTDIAQARYDAGAVAVAVHKGQGVSGQEFTGDYTEYKYTWTVLVDGLEVMCSGNEEGVANLVEWSVDGC